MAQPTKHEVEIKLRVQDLAALLNRLHRIGARYKARVFEQNILYDTPDSAFRRAGRLLRLRLETPVPPGPTDSGTRLVRPKLRPQRAILTAKAPPRPGGRGSHRARYKERLEREVVLHKATQFVRVIKPLGLRPSFVYEKFRSSFELPELHVDLDETPVGTFLELEGSPLAIDRAARTLGFEPREYIRDTYWDVYAADCRRRGCAVKNMVFR
jgi:adenylate cyclase, class 2